MSRATAVDPGGLPTAGRRRGDHQLSSDAARRALRDLGRLRREQGRPRSPDATLAAEEPGSPGTRSIRATCARPCIRPPSPARTSATGRVPETVVPAFLAAGRFDGLPSGRYRAGELRPPAGECGHGVIGTAPAAARPRASTPGRPHGDGAARAPRSARDEVRLLVADDRPGSAPRDFRELADHLEPGDLLVVNTSATRARSSSTASADGAAGRRAPGQPARDGTRVAELRTAPGRGPRPCSTVPTPACDDRARRPGGRADPAEPYPRPDRRPPARATGSGGAQVGGDGSLAGYLAGRPTDQLRLPEPAVPARGLPDDLRRPPRAAPRCRAPARPFTPELVTRLVARGVIVAPITLHTGVSSQDVGEAPQAEWFEVRRPPRRWSTRPEPAAAG